MSNTNYQVFWQEALKQIREEYKSQNKEDEFIIWFKMEYIDDQGSTINVKIPSEFMKQELISRGYIDQIKNKLSQITGQSDFEIAMQISNFSTMPVTDIQQEINKNKSSEYATQISQSTNSMNSMNSTTPTYSAHPAEVTQSPQGSQSSQSFQSSQAQNLDNNNYLKHLQLDPKFTFDTFVTDDNNTFAYTVSLAAAKNPGKQHNPILLYGGVGLGKTHLMQSIGNYIFNEKKGKIKICYITSENLLNEFVQSLQNKNTKNDTSKEFKNKYRNYDVFLLDDIQFIAGKDKFQEECFHTFNALSEHNTQMVFTCDRPINELKELEGRLKTRFSSGITIDLKPPSYETRIAIINKKLEIENKTMLPKTIDFIAKNVQSNVRELEASIKTVVSYQDLIKKEVTIDIAKEILKDLISGPQSISVSLDVILKVVADAENTSIADIKGKNRNKKIAQTRHIAIYIARELLEYSYPELGNEFGGRDHSTILTAYNNMADKIKTDPSFEQKIKNIIEQIKSYKKI